MEKAIDLLCVGHSAVDYVMVVDRYPKANEKVKAQSFHRFFGGPAATAAVAAARLGAEVAFVGHCGDDQEGVDMREAFRREGVDAHGLVVREGMQSRKSLIFVESSTGRRTVANYSDPELEQAPAPSLAGRVRPKIILFDGFELPMIKTFMEKAAEWEAATVLDAGSLRPGSEWLASRVDYLIASQKFARQFSGQNSKAAAINALFKTNRRFAAITLGSHGCVARTKEGTMELPAFPTAVSDTTGAGDAFHGAFCRSLLGGSLSNRDRLRFSSAVAALSCQGLGGRSALPNLEQTLAFLEQHARDFPKTFA